MPSRGIARSRLGLSVILSSSAGTREMTWLADLAEQSGDVRTADLVDFAIGEADPFKGAKQLR